MLALRHNAISQRSRAGFTLLELLVAITILGLMMPLLYAILQTGVKAWTHGQSHFLRANRVQSVQTYLQSQIRQIYPKFLSAGQAGAQVDFDGSRDAVKFISPMPAALKAGGMAYTRIAVVQDDDGMRLILSQWPELAWDENATPTSTTLIKGLKSADFSYFGKDSLQTSPSWHDTWSGKRELPKLIRLRAQFTDGTQSWPEFVVAPRISVDAGCIYDPLTKYCQGR